MSVMVSTGALDFTGLGWSLPTSPSRSSCHSGILLPFALISIGVPAWVKGILSPGQVFFITVLLLALILSQVVSYLRARGEGLGVYTKAGLMTRPERVVLLGTGLIVNQIEWFLLAIAVVSCFTLFQRLFTIRDMLDKAG